MRFSKALVALAGLATAADAIHMRKKKYYLQQRADEATCEKAIKAIAERVTEPAADNSVLNGDNPGVITDTMTKSPALTKDSTICTKLKADCNALAKPLPNDIAVTVAPKKTLTIAGASGTKPIDMKDLYAKFPTCETEWAPNADEKKCLDAMKNGDNALDEEACKKVGTDCPNNDASSNAGMYAASRDPSTRLYKNALQVSPDHADRADSCKKLMDGSGGSSASR